MNILKYVTFTLFVIFLVFFTNNLLKSFANSAQDRWTYDYAESIVAHTTNQIILSRDGAAEKPCTDSALSQGHFCSYPILFSQMLSFFKSYHDQLILGRIYSITSSVGCLMLLILIFFQLSPTKIHFMHALALSTPLFYLQTSVFEWAQMARPDMLAFLLALTGFYLVNKKAIVWSAVFFVLSLATKQISLVILILSILTLWKSNIKQMALFLMYFCLFLLVYIVIMTFYYGTGYWVHLYSQHSFHFLTTRFAEFTFSYLIVHISLLFAALYAISTIQDKNQRYIFSAWLLLSIVFALTGIGRIGSNYNYFLDLSAPLTITSLQFILHLQKQKQHYAILIFLVLLVRLQFETYLHSVKYFDKMLLHRRTTLVIEQKNLDLLANKKVLCEKPYLCFDHNLTPDYFGYEINYSSNQNLTKRLNQKVIDQLLDYDYIITEGEIFDSEQPGQKNNLQFLSDKIRSNFYYLKSSSNLVIYAKK